MKRLTYLLLILCLSCGAKKTSTTNPDGKPKTEQDILAENKIQFKRIYYCQIYNDKPDTINGDLSELVEYDKKGNSIREESYYGDDFAIKRFINYNDSGETISMENRDYYDKLTRKYSYLYQNGKNVKRVITGPVGEELGTLLYTFDNAGNCIEMQGKYVDTLMNDRWVMTYDNKGKQLTNLRYDYQNKLISEEHTTHISDTSYSIVSRDYSADAYYPNTKSTSIFSKDKRPIISEFITNLTTGEGHRQEFEYHANGLLKGIWSIELPANKKTSYRMVKYQKFD